ncbi:MAG: VRR-NUC domain-containing protein [Anaerococcus vaginalis]|uniref:VRR-NUC domain-containing protein n=1 Tax=Anaerococcus vaginalis TaxID=33037 RepID=UPI002909E415|nr:VRR-NUC domain-containing protein [Anaerococcus vaginalis]MDU4378119.1 VRR-NUC domain-containing protein [Anaerococcus vaginalis]
MREKSYENKIKKFIESVGGWWVKFHGNAFTRDGVPDLLCCVNGKFLAIEVKGDGGEPSELQLHEIEEIKKAGGVALVSYPDDFDELKKLIRRLL